MRVRQAGTLEYLREIRQVPCADCGGRFKAYQMDFDHRDRSAKSFRLTSGRAMLMARSRLLEEIGKCDVVCANCHRVRTQRFEATRDRRSPPTAPSEKRKERLWKEQAALLRQIRDVACADCEGRFPVCVMDFDHRDPATKAFTISRKVGRTSSDALLAEIAKCDIVCANCHRERTHLRFHVTERE